MQSYSYIAIDRSGRNATGRMMANDEAQLEEKLRTAGMWLVEAKLEKGADKAKTKNDFLAGFQSAPRREIINFCTLMNFQLRVGISMVPALQVAAEDCEHPGFRKVLDEIRQMVETGIPLADGLERYPRMFTKEFVSLIRSGEASGALPEAFMELKKYLEWQEQIIADVRQATIYPAIIAVVVSSFVMLLFTFVIPKFVVLLKAVGVPLPAPTRIIFGISDFAKATWFYWIAAVTLGPIAIKLARRNKKFDIFFDKVKFKMPVFGDLNHMLVISRFAHNMAVLYRSGVSLVQSIELCQGLVGSTLVAENLVDVCQGVKEGAPLSESLKRHPVFPGLLVRMVVMGEKTGNLDKALENVSDFYNLVVPRKIKKVFSIMEPAMIIFLVGIVGLVALAIFMPIISMLGAIKK